MSMMDDEIQTCKTRSKYIQSHQVAIPVLLASFHSKSFGLTFSRVHSHWKTTADLFNAQHSIQFACTKRSFTSARVLCSSFNGSSLSSQMTCWICTLMVKVPVTLSKELPAGLGLHSANSSNLSADVGLRTASQNSNKMFQLIVNYIRAHPNFERFLASSSNLTDAKIPLHFFQDYEMFCEGE